MSARSPWGGLVLLSHKPGDRILFNVIPGRCDSIEPSGAQLRTENLEIPGSALAGCPGMTAVMTQSYSSALRTAPGVIAGPDGQIACSNLPAQMHDSSALTRQGRSAGAKNGVRQKTHFACWIKCITGRRPSRKYILLSFFQKS